MMLDGKLVCIFGGGGFVGRYIAEQMLRDGARVRIAQRDPKQALRIKPLGNLGQTQFASADITKPESVARAVYGCDVVINLVGILKGDFNKIHVEGARNIAEAATAAGCEALIQISAIGADVQSPSLYGRSKGRGEEAVLTAFPDAVIMRPSIIFGTDDSFVNRFAGMIAALPIVPIIGAEAKFQPIFAGDVAKAVSAALKKYSSYGGQTFELGGPEIISMGELNRRIAHSAGRKRTFIEIPNSISKIIASVTGPLPGAPITADQFKMLGQDNIVAEGAHNLKTLGVSPTPLASLLPGWMDEYAPRGRFEAKTTS